MRTPVKRTEVVLKGRKKIRKPALLGLAEKLMEAPTRFELVMEVLQTSALPLGDGATETLGSEARYI
jgi:hypothetical protein